MAHGSDPTDPYTNILNGSYSQYQGVQVEGIKDS